MCQYETRLTLIVDVKSSESRAEVTRLLSEVPHVTKVECKGDGTGVDIYAITDGDTFDAEACAAKLKPWSERHNKTVFIDGADAKAIL